MHELSLAEEVLRIVEEAAEKERVRRVRTVSMEIGTLANVELEAFRFAFESLAPGTIAEGARLDITSLTASGACVACGRVAPLHDRLEACPGCGGGPRRASGGTEFQVKSVEVE